MSRLLIGFLALLVLPAAGLAQAPARDVPEAAGGSASIRGRVADAVTGRPLSRVEVHAAAGTGQQASGLTDGNGRYDLSGLPAGTYAVTGTKANYVRTSWGETRPEGPGKSVTLTNGQTLDNVNFSLRRAGAVTGTIVDELGDPVTDVAVTAMRYQYVQGSRHLTPSGRSGQTNDIGEYRLYGLSPGQYYISATLRNIGGPATETTDRAGYAATFYPGTGNVADALRLTIAAGQTFTGVNLTLLPIQTVKVSGTAVDADGKAMAGAMVAALQRLGVGQMPSSVSPVRQDGTFTLNGMTPGDYTLHINAPTGETAAADITVSSGDIADVQLVAGKPSTIRGRVVFAGGAADVPRPTAIQVSATRADPLAGRGQARVSDDGTFEMSLPAGHALVRAVMAGPATAPAGGGSAPLWRLNRVILNDDDVGDVGIEVPPNTVIENVIVEMTNRSNEVSGRVTDASGNTVRDCIVIVFAQDPARWTVQTRYLSVARPGPDDLFHVRLLPGDYFAAAMAEVEAGAWTDREFLAQARERATRFSIADGEKRTVDLPLSPVPVF